MPRLPERHTQPGSARPHRCDMNDERFDTLYPTSAIAQSLTELAPVLLICGQLAEI